MAQPMSTTPCDPARAAMIVANELLCIYIAARLSLPCGFAFQLLSLLLTLSPQRWHPVGPSFSSPFDASRVHRTFTSSVCFFPVYFERVCDYLTGKDISTHLSLELINHTRHLNLRRPVLRPSPAHFTQ